MIEKKITRSELKRAAILDAATLAFQKQGFKATSMDDIAKRAAVSKRTVYNHFASKEVLFNAILLDMISMWQGVEPVEFSTVKPLSEQLEKLARHEIKLLQSDNFIASAKVILAESIHAPELIQAAMVTLNAQETPMSAWFNAAVVAKAVDADSAEQVMTQFVGVIKAFCFWPQLTLGSAFPSAMEIDKIVDMSTQMIIKQYCQGDS